MDRILKGLCESKVEQVPPIRHYLYKESALLFESFKNETNVDLMAKQYIKILENYYEILEQNYDQTAKTERAIMYEVMSIFKLCQLLYFSNEPCKPKQLLKWQNETFYPLLWQHDRHGIYKDLLNHPDFWPFAYRLAIFGQNETLTDLFSRITPSQEWKHLFDQMLCMLKGDYSLNLSTSDHPAYTVCLILAGDDEAVKQYAIHPSQCFLIDRLRGIQRMNPQGVLESFLSDNIYQALSACVDYDPWLLAHLTILLDYKKVLTVPVIVDKIEIACRDYFVLIYSACLKHTHWKEAFMYLLSCGELGKQAIQQHLKTIEFDEKIVDFCKKHNMKKEGLSLYEKKAAYFFELKEYQLAYHYYNLSENLNRRDEVLKQVILEYTITGALSDIFVKTPNEISKLYICLKDIKQSIDNQNCTVASRQYQSLVELVLPEWILNHIFYLGVELVKKTKLEKTALLYLKKLWRQLQQEDVDSDALDTCSILIARALVE